MLFCPTKCQGLLELVAEDGKEVFYQCYACRSFWKARKQDPVEIRQLTLTKASSEEMKAAVR